MKRNVRCVVSVVSHVRDCMHEKVVVNAELIEGNLGH